MRYIKYIALCVLAASLLAVTGCANISGSAYSADQTRSAQTVQYGTVKSVHEVQVEGDTNGGLGAVGGGVAAVCSAVWSVVEADVPWVRLSALWPEPDLAMPEKRP